MWTATGGGGRHAVSVTSSLAHQRACLTFVAAPPTSPVRLASLPAPVSPSLGSIFRTPCCCARQEKRHTTTFGWQRLTLCGCLFAARPSIWWRRLLVFATWP